MIFGVVVKTESDSLLVARLLVEQQASTSSHHIFIFIYTPIVKKRLFGLLDKIGRAHV